MKKTFFRMYTGVLAAAFLFLATAFSILQDNDGQIPWGTKTITWDDFKGPHDRRSSGIASTYSYIYMDLLKDDAGKISVDVKAYFDSEKSWVIYKEKSVLNHERGHFDIAELYARKLRKKISETSFTRESYKHEIWSIYREYNDAMDKYQDIYDDETDSSMDTPNQKTWEAQLKKDIENLSAYKNPLIQLKFKENK